MRKTTTATIAGICCASALLTGAFMTGCVDNKNINESNDESANDTVVVAEETQDDVANTENDEIAEAVEGNDLTKNGPSTSQVVPAGEQVTFTWHPQTVDYATYVPGEHGDAELQHKTIYCVSNGDGSFSFTTTNGTHLTATFTDDYIPALDEYDVTIIDDAGNEVIMPTNGGEWILSDGTPL